MGFLGATIFFLGVAMFFLGATSVGMGFLGATIVGFFVEMGTDGAVFLPSVFLVTTTLLACVLIGFDLVLASFDLSSTLLLNCGLLVTVVVVVDGGNSCDLATVLRGFDGASVFFFNSRSFLRAANSNCAFRTCGGGLQAEMFLPRDTGSLVILPDANSRCFNCVMTLFDFPRETGRGFGLIVAGATATTVVLSSNGGDDDGGDGGGCAAADVGNVGDADRTSDACCCCCGSFS